MVRNFGRSTWKANYNTVAYGSTKGSNTSTGTYYTGYYYTNCTSATVSTNGATVYRYFNADTYTVTCIDIIGINPNNAILGQSIWSAVYDSNVSGTSQGTDTSIGAYYKDYYYVGASSTKVTTSGTTVYRYFEPETILEMPDTGSKNKIIFILLGVCLITYSFFKKERRQII